MKDVKPRGTWGFRKAIQSVQGRSSRQTWVSVRAASFWWVCLVGRERELQDADASRNKAEQAAAACPLLYLRLGIFDAWGLPVQDAIACVDHLLGLASFLKGWLQLHSDIFTHWGKKTQHRLLSASESLQGAGSQQNRPKWTPLQEWVELMLGAEKGVSTRPAVEFSGWK